MPIMAGWVSSAAFGGNNGAGPGKRDFGTDLISVVAAIRQELVETTADGVEQWAEALLIVRLPRRQDEGEREAVRIAACVEFGRKAAARSAERLGRTSAFFIPAAQ